MERSAPMADYLGLSRPDLKSETRSNLSWFRYHTDALDNPKIQTLPAVLFRFWVNLLCVSKKVDGFLPESLEISFRCRVPEPQVKEWLAELKRRRLIDVTADGELLIHDWNEHQYVSDSSTERVRKHRAKRKGNVSVTPPEQSRADYRADQSRPEAPPPSVAYSEWPETAAAVAAIDPATNGIFTARLVQAVLQAALSDGKVNMPDVDDAAIARAVRESVATYTGRGRHGAGLLLRRVPEIIINWGHEENESRK